CWPVSAGGRLAPGHRCDVAELLSGTRPRRQMPGCRGPGWVGSDGSEEPGTACQHLGYTGGQLLDFVLRQARFRALRSARTASTARATSSAVGRVDGWTVGWAVWPSSRGASLATKGRIS